jgi:hypothetical protein
MVLPPATCALIPTETERSFLLDLTENKDGSKKIRVNFFKEVKIMTAAQ